MKIKVDCFRKIKVKLLPAWDKQGELFRRRTDYKTNKQKNPKTKRNPPNNQTKLNKAKTKTKQTSKQNTHKRKKKKEEKLF